VNDPAYADEEIIKLYNQVVSDAGLDPKQATYGTGWIFAITMVEALKRAAELPGGLTRPNLVIANRSLDFEHPLVLEGIATRLEGMNDAYFIEGGQMREYVFDEATGTGGYRDVGEVINLEGEAGTFTD
jgi:hypothetical protein